MQAMQKSILAIALTSLALTACQQESSSPSQPNPTQPISGDQTATHSLCVSERVGSESEVLPMQPRHGASTLTTIDSLNQVGADFGVEVLSKIDLSEGQGMEEYLANILELKLANATLLSIGSSQLTAALSALALFHACSSEEYASSGCSTRVIEPWVTDDPEAEYTRLNTKVNGQHYVRRVELSSSAQGPWQEMMRIEGKIGDIGNFSLFTPTEQGDEDQLVYQRSASGEESVQFSSEKQNFTITENASCAGSIDYHAISDVQEVSLNGSWQFRQGRTQASLELELKEFGDQPASYDKSYSW